MSVDKPDFDLPKTNNINEDVSLVDVNGLKEVMKKRNKRTIIYSTIALCITGVVGIILLTYLVFIQEGIISMNSNTIDNSQKQQLIIQKHFQKLNPLQIVKNYQRAQKMKEEEMFVIVIEKLQSKLSPSVSRMIAASLLSECDKKNIDENLILALMYAESSIDPMKESNMGACGLMQVRYKTWKEEPELTDNGVDKWHKLFWIEENIKAGTDIFKKFYNESGNNINTTLYRYNSGSPKIPEKPNEEVLKYINKIMYYHYYIQNLVRGNNETSKGFNK